MEKKPPINVLHLFPVLDEMLIQLLTSLNEDEWMAPTVAKLWTVKDISAHLLDGNLKGLSILRDHYFGLKPEKIASPADLVSFINNINADWVAAAKRLSPQLIIELLKSTGAQYTAQLRSLNAFDEAVFAVSWAGQEQSANWFHVAREYTEKFIHQQQIRDAVNKPGLMSRELFYPFIDILIHGLPHTYRNVAAATNTIVRLTILSEIGGEWNIRKSESAWELITESELELAPEWLPTAEIKLLPSDAWKLFTKSIRKEAIMERVAISGQKELAITALDMVSVMA